MSDQNSTVIVQKQLDAYNSLDIDSFVVCFAEDIKMYELEGNKIICEGQEVFRERYAQLFSSSPQLHVKLVNRIHSGDLVIDHEHVTGMRDLEPFDAVAIYKVENSIITVLTGSSQIYC